MTAFAPPHTGLPTGAITPDDPRYDTASSGFNLIFRHRPDVIVDAASVEDVAAAVRHAAATGAKVAVQATGHGVTVPADGAVLILTRGLDDVEIDPDAWTARIGAGSKWAPVLAAAQSHGLAPLLGSSSDVGAVGYTLGGGFGWLGRRYGLAADHVRSFTVVTADGSVIRTDEDSHPDLFWALRGGGAGSLGVVVAMEIDLVPVTEVYAGNLWYPAELAAELFAFYTDWSAKLPDEMTTSFAMMAMPPLDEVPEPMRGRTFAVIRGCHSGDPAEAKALVDEWRSRWEPEMDLFGPMPFTMADTISDEPTDPVPAISSARWLTGLDTDVLAAVTEALAPAPHPSSVAVVEIRHAGGAVGRHVDGSSYTARDAERLVHAVALAFDPDMAADGAARIARMWERLTPYLSGAAYLNLVEGDERRQQAKASFGAATWQRLQAVKQAYDPENLFANGIL